MALVQTFPEFTCDKLREGTVLSVDDTPGYEIPFKRDGNFAKVFSVILTNRHVKLDAAPAAGKTTVLPRKLAEHTGRLVILILPFENLASLVYDYVKQVTETVPVELMSTVDHPYPSTGILITFAGCLVARWLQKAELDLPSCYVLHDESHESGAATAAIKAFTLSSTSVLSYVEMSATAGAEEGRTMISSGRLIKRTYVGDQFADPWSVEEVGAPWSVPKMNGNILIFEDDPGRAEKLIQAYSMCGVPCFRWTARMEIATLRADFSLVQSTPNRHYVIIADSSFRSGYTLPVSTIVDTGIIRRVVVDERGHPVKSSREIYENEAHQSACRGGRLDKLTTVYWRPMSALLRRRAVLEQTDAEAFAVMCVVLGFEIPGPLRGTRAARGIIPKDIFTALDGDMPIACIPEPNMVPSIEFNAVRKRRASITIETAPSAIGDDDLDGEYSWVERMRENLEAFSLSGLGCGEWVEPTFGEYITALDLLDVTSTVGLFPDEANSVMRMLNSADSKYIMSTWDEITKSEAIKHLLKSYNVLIIQLHGATLALNEAKVRRGDKNTYLVTKWAASMAEVLAQITIEAQKTFVYICDLSRDFVVLEDGCLDMTDQEALCKAQFLKGFHTIPNSVRSSAPSLDSSRIKSVSSSSASTTSSAPRSITSGEPKKKIEYSKSLRLSAWAAGVPADVYYRRLRLKAREQQAFKKYIETHPIT